MRYRFDAFELDTDTYELRRQGLPCPMEPQVFEVLAYLVAHQDRLVSRDELMEQVWHSRFISDSTLSSRIMAARRVLGDSGQAQRYIRTVHGRGFRFVGELEAGVQGDTAEGVPANATAPPAAPFASELDQQIGFCRTADGVRIAYATVGQGPPIVKAPNWLTHLQHEWKSPVWRHWWEELTRDHTLIRFDQRGCGLSDWNVPDFSFETWVLDLETVVAATGVERFTLLGISQGGAVAIEYAVRHPERVAQLVLCGAYTRGWARRGQALTENEAVLTLMREGWGRDNPAYRQLFTLTFMPEATAEQMTWFNELQRVSTSAENAVRLRQASGQIDVLERLQLVSVPTLVLHATGDERVPFSEGKLLASLIPNARLVALDSRNHLTLAEEPAWPQLLTAVRTFLVAAEEAPVADDHRSASWQPPQA